MTDGLGRNTTARSTRTSSPLTSKNLIFSGSLGPPGASEVGQWCKVNRGGEPVRVLSWEAKPLAGEDDEGLSSGGGGLWRGCTKHEIIKDAETTGPADESDMGINGLGGDW